MTPQPKSGGRRRGSRRTQAARVEPSRKAPASPWTVTSLAEVSRFFNKNITAVERWQRSGMPGQAREWDLQAIARWRIARAQARLRETRKRQLDGDPDKAIVRAKAGLAGLKLNQLRRRLVPVKDHRAFIRKLSRTIAVRLKVFADSLPSQIRGLDHGPQDRVIKDRIWELLEDLSQTAGGDADDEQGGKA